jgi:type I restriction enzyme S subunit
MSWVKKTIGELCIIEKGKIGIQKATPGEFPLVVTAEERLSHNEYHFEGNAVVIPLVSSTGHGHRSLKRIHFQSGKFAVGNILCAVIPNDENILRADYLYRFLDLNREKELVGRMRGMANVTLPMKEIAQIEIPVPPIEAQIDFVEQYSTLEEKSNYLGVELKHQLDLVKQLRQAILREAMQGKLVPQDPNDEPASVLLEKIKAEKERLIKKKKIKKQKPLPSITEEEIPFEIPDNWVWCRLGELAINRDGERKPISQSERESREKIYDYYGASGIIDQIDGYTHNGKYVLIGEDGANLRAKSTPIAFIAEGKFWVNNHAHVLEFVDDITNYFMTYCLNIIDINSFITGGFQPKLSQGNLIQIEIPLPPLSEQQRIVAKLDELMGYCDELEASIKESQQQNELLLQQVLREALEPKVKEAAQ